MGPQPETERGKTQVQEEERKETRAAERAPGERHLRGRVVSEAQAEEAEERAAVGRLEREEKLAPARRAVRARHQHRPPRVQRLVLDLRRAGRPDM
jgi:hypothetical protein